MRNRAGKRTTRRNPYLLCAPEGVRVAAPSKPPHPEGFRGPAGASHSGLWTRRTPSPFCSLLLAFLAACSLPVAAQSSETGSHAGYGYVFAAPGASSGSGFSSGTFHTGGGGEVFLYKGLTLGGELGAILPWRDPGAALGLGSVNGSYHFFPSDSGRKAVPFLTAGYTNLFRTGSLNLWNIGGGVTFWSDKDVGLRLEFRDHILNLNPGPVAHLWQARFAVVFR